LFIFLTAVVLIGLICWLIYRLIKRRKLQQTVVISK
jgi:multisubunit Na+/H+ antiporter MnhF subunit